MGAADPSVEFLAAVNLALAAGILGVLLAARGSTGLAAAVRGAPWRREIAVFAFGVLVGGAVIATALPAGHIAAPAPVAADAAPRFDSLDKAVAELKADISAGFLAEGKQVAAGDRELQQILVRIDEAIQKRQPDPATSAKVSLYWAGVAVKPRSAPVVWVAMQNLGTAPALIKAADIRFCGLRDSKIDPGGCIAARANVPQCGRTFVCEKDMAMLQGIGGEKIRYATVPPRFGRNAPFGIVLTMDCTDGTGHACDIGGLSAICRNGSNGDAKNLCNLEPAAAQAAPSLPAPSAAGAAQAADLKPVAAGIQTPVNR